MLLWKLDWNIPIHTSTLQRDMRGSWDSPQVAVWCGHPLTDLQQRRNVTAGWCWSLTEGVELHAPASLLCWQASKKEIFFALYHIHELRFLWVSSDSQFFSNCYKYYLLSSSISHLWCNFKFSLCSVLMLKDPIWNIRLKFNFFIWLILDLTGKLPNYCFWWLLLIAKNSYKMAQTQMLA